MVHTIILPKLGQMTEESTILRWLKREGDLVSKGDTLFEMETDKAVMEAESFFDGTLLKILVPEGVNVPVMTPVAFVGAPGEALPDLEPSRPPATASSPQPSAEPIPVSPAAKPVEKPSARQPSAPPVVSPGAEMVPPRQKISPRARRLIKESLIDPALVRGSGPGGRVVERDVTHFLEDSGYSRIRFTPAAKRLMADHRLFLPMIQGSGENGKITVADVERALAERPKPLSKMRQIIARRMRESASSIPHFQVTMAVDLTEVSRWREQLKTEGMAFSINDFVLKAVAMALVEYPAVNSSFENDSVSWHAHVNLGMAVSVEEGLLVPVIQQVEKLTLMEVRDQSRILAEKARQRRLSVEEMTGGTFTVSNLGMLGVESFTAIINPGESAILAVAGVADQPAVLNGEIVIRKIMKMTISADHRVLDGALAAEFLNSIKRKLEDPSLWKAMI
jgi:pyruvate dehydrogenase E2 component (dihydrolipoamide acetyltransferase)